MGDNAHTLTPQEIRDSKINALDYVRGQLRAGNTQAFVILNNSMQNKEFGFFTAKLNPDGEVTDLKTMPASPVKEKEIRKLTAQVEKLKNDVAKCETEIKSYQDKALYSRAESWAGVKSNMTTALRMAESKLENLKTQEPIMIKTAIDEIDAYIEFIKKTIIADVEAQKKNLIERLKAVEGEPKK